MKIRDEQIRTFMEEALRRDPRGECPGEVELAAFASMSPEDRERSEVLSHLARCPMCAHTVMTLQTILEEPEGEREVRTPIRALERAARLDPAGREVMDVVIRFAKGVAQIVQKSGGVIGGLVHSADQVRGVGTVVSENLVSLKKEFAPFTAEVDVERTRPDRAEVLIRLTEDGGNKLAKGLRVSLFERDMEMESAMVEDGQAVFENLKFGQYRLEITRVGEPVGRITLEMKGEGK